MRRSYNESTIIKKKKNRKEKYGTARWCNLFTRTLAKLAIDKNARGSLLSFAAFGPIDRTLCCGPLLHWPLKKVRRRTKTELRSIEWALCSDSECGAPATKSQLVHSAVSHVRLFIFFFLVRLLAIRQLIPDKNLQNEKYKIRKQKPLTNTDVASANSEPIKCT